MRATARSGTPRALRRRVPAAVDPQLLAPGLSRDYLLYHQVCPIARTSDGGLKVAATSEAFLGDAVPDLETLYGCRVVVEEVSRDELMQLIARWTLDLERPGIDVGTDGADDQLSDVRDLAIQPPVIRLLNLLVRDAYDARASDIHIEATSSGLRTRFRVDGVLVPAIDCPPEYQFAIVSRVKLLANLDIAERRRPQDGRIRVRLDERELDLRVSTVPTSHGESVVLRLLDRGGAPVSLSDLGLSADTLPAFTRDLGRPHGLIIVTGPTGSGKTTTLYSALQLRSADAEKIITVEDPIEYALTDIVQVPVHRTAGVTFATALRSILRQDPDVVMIGEMRDEETAEIAVQASLTGHLVLSTLHTNDAVGAVLRLRDLGVPEYLIAATLQSVLSQRLMRTVCSECVEWRDENLDGAVPGGRVARAVGCSACRGTGYRGRCGVFEYLAISPSLRDAISQRAELERLRELAMSEGLNSLENDAWKKVAEGLTTPEELRRVIHA